MRCVPELDKFNGNHWIEPTQEIAKDTRDRVVAPYRSGEGRLV
jgi:hypothetical protein